MKNTVKGKARILLVISDAYIGLQLLSCLRSCNAEVEILDFTSSFHLRLSRICRNYRLAETDKISASGPAAAMMLQDLHREYGFDTTIAAGMDASLLLARARPFIEDFRVFPMGDEATLKWLNNKWQFAGLCTRLGLPHPATSIMTNLNDCLPSWYNGEEIIIKPLSQSGGRGVRLIKSRDALLDCIQDLQTREELPYLLQEYIPGADGVLALLANNGRVIAATVQLYAEDHRSVKFCDLPEVIAMGEKIVVAESLTGVVEFDLRHDSRDGSWWLTECNPRFWASVALSAFVGVNFVRLGLQAADNPALFPEMYPAPEGEWMSLKEMMRRLTREGLAINNFRVSMWNGLRSTWSDPLPHLFVRPDARLHNLQ